MPDGINLIPAVLLGMVGAALAVGVTYLLAARWKRRCGFSYGVSAFVFYAFFYIAAFEYGILDAIRMGKSVPDDMLDILVLGHSAITAVGVTIFTLLVFGLFVGLRPPLEGNLDSVQACTGSAAFCLIMAVFLNPVGAVERLRGVSMASLHEANIASAAMARKKAPKVTKPRPARLPAVFPDSGLVLRVEIKGGRITHYIFGDAQKRSRAGLEAYARMALAHRLYFDNAKPGPVVIRDAISTRRLATRYPDGRFRQQIAGRKPKK